MDDLEGRAVVVLQLVGVVQPREHLASDERGELRGQPLVALTQRGEESVQTDPLQVAHDHVVAVARDPDLEGLGDVRVVEPTREAGLVEEHLDHLFVVLEVGVEQFQHHQLAEVVGAPLERQEDLPGPSLAQRRQDVVLADPTRGEGLHRPLRRARLDLVHPAHRHQSTCPRAVRICTESPANTVLLGTFAPIPLGNPLESLLVDAGIELANSPVCLART